MLQNSFQKRSTVPKSDSPFHGEVRDPHYLLHQIVLRLNLYGIDFDPFQVVEHLIEYKGAHLVDTQDTREKQNIGELWHQRATAKVSFSWRRSRIPTGKVLWIKLPPHLPNLSSA